MSFASPLTSGLRRLPALLAFLAVAGCGGPNSPLAANSDHDRDRRMLTAAYEDIDQFYIQKPDLQNLTIGGLSALAAIDDKISIKPETGKLDLQYGNHTAAVFTINDRFDSDDWAALTAKALAAARQTSPSVGKADSEVIYKTVFNGIVARLDPFSRYSGHDQAMENRATREGFGGIGVRISVEDGIVRVVSVMHYTPAERIGLHSDDVITAIDGTPTKGLDQQAVVSLLRGPVDSRVLLSVQRPGTANPLMMTVVRAHVVPETVTYRREGDIGYFRIYQFNQDTADSLQRAIENARNDIGDQMRGIVLDLRDDPGGLLDQAVAVSDLFMTSGRIVSTQGRHPDSRQYFEATSGDITRGLPIAVLINGGSASASEIVAAALQDSGRGVIIGSNSYGKGTVQTVLRMPNDGEFTLTWARFHAPSGYTLHHLGVLPTICTEKGDEDATSIMAELGTGRLKPIPVLQRDTVSPDDTASLDKLRAACPAFRGTRALDLDVALRLLNQPRLYAKAVALAEAGPSALAAQSQGQAPIQP
ncbi:MAG: carboxyl-terminal processing protease [Rhodospirillaceae bacterium]|jgi:carboxyl-terminal processing protease|nr:carboxyl-terminal processing protease [Rhodospirillaceae bacterium]